MRNNMRKGANRIMYSTVLDFGATVDVRDIAGASALHKASEWQNLQMVQLLLERGASVNARYNRG